MSIAQLLHTQRRWANPYQGWGTEGGFPP